MKKEKQRASDDAKVYGVSIEEKFVRIESSEDIKMLENPEYLKRAKKESRTTLITSVGNFIFYKGKIRYFEPSNLALADRVEKHLNTLARRSAAGYQGHGELLMNYRVTRIPRPEAYH